MFRSTRWLIAEIAFLLVASSVLGAFGFPMFLPYSWHLYLHILGVILFLGNIIVTGLWMVVAERSGDSSALRFASTTVNWADVAFTAPGIILVVINGLTLATRWGGPLGTGWLTASVSLFGVSGALWVLFLIRYQDRMARISEASRSATDLPREFYTVLHQWYRWGAIAMIVPVVTSMLMVVKCHIRAWGIRSTNQKSAVAMRMPGG
jgi:uncharacterized membrane protein